MGPLCRWAGLRLGIAAIVLVAAAGCREEAAPPPSAPPVVDVVVVTARDVPVIKEWIGTTTGFIDAQVRARVSGYLTHQDYTEGSFVHKDDLLFRLDPRPFEAQLDQANAEHQKAIAAKGKTALDVTRLTPLARTGAVPQQDLDNSIQADAAAAAMIDATNAQVELAKLNLGYTRVLSPIDGIAGIAQAQVGDLVGALNSQVLTTVSTVDPIKVYFPVSEQEYLLASKRLEELSAMPEADRPAIVEMILSDGTAYAHKGRFFTADRQVDVTTGAIRIAALFPNPGNVMRPGQYAKVRATVDTLRGAAVVPQRAVQEMQGVFMVGVVGGNNLAELRSVKMGQRTGSDWVITEGIKPGEMVVVEGYQKLKAGEPVTPRAWEPGAGGTPTSNTAPGPTASAPTQPAPPSTPTGPVSPANSPAAGATTSK
jgi:membrane fusion protein (multidrug efflux system)